MSVLINNQTKNLEQFIELLFSHGLISKEDFVSLREMDSLSQVYDKLLTQGKNPISLAKAFAQAEKIPFLQEIAIEPEANSVLDQSLALNYGFLPFELDDKNKVLKVAMDDPEKVEKLNKDSIKKLENKVGFKIEIYFTADLDWQKSTGSIDQGSAVIDRIPKEIFTKYNAVVLRMADPKTVEIGAIDPNNEQLKEFINAVSQKSDIGFKIVKIDPELYKQKLNEGSPLDLSGDASGDDKTKTAETDEKRAVSKLQETNLDKLLSKKQVTIEDIKSYATAGQIPELIASLLALAIEQDASDIHIEPFEKALRVRFRIDGILRDKLALTVSMAPSIVTRIKVMSALKIDEQRIPQDGRFDFQVGSKLVDVRVSTLPTVYGEKVALRLLDKSSHILDLKALGVDGINYDRIMKAIAKPYGIILSTGPTGSGKSTTLYAAISILNKPEVNIVTLEDPVEYEIPGVNQTQVKPHIGFGFAEGLRSILRQDPNIIMVGEIRDKETAELTVQASLTGHIVLSTLHTNNAASAIPRFTNLGVEPFLLTSALSAVVGQRLVRRICPDCRTEMKLPEVVMQNVQKELKQINYNGELRFYKGKGCQNCTEGFKGRIGIYEVLEMNSAIEDLALQRSPAQNIFSQAVKDGMITMKQDGLLKCLRGLTTVDEVIRVTSES